MSLSVLSLQINPLRQMKKKFLYFLGGVIALFLLIGIFAPEPSPEVQSLETGSQAQNNQIESITEAATTTPANPVATEAEPTQRATSLPTSPKPEQKQTQTQTQFTYYPVTDVVDGDTIKINMDGKTETLRLIGMDTPETVDPRKPVQCFGKEASNKAKELLSGQKVRIELDPTQGERDKYDRLLAYVYRDDGIFYNKYMIEQGYAHEYTYNTPYKYQADFKAAQKSAQANQAGLWSPTTCNGDTTSSTSQTEATPSTTQSGGKFYTSSHYSAKYYYPESCDGWKSLSPTYLKSFDTLEALLASYNRTKSPQCE